VIPEKKSRPQCEIDSCNPPASPMKNPRLFKKVEHNIRYA